MLWVQDVATVACELVVFAWIYGRLSESRTKNASAYSYVTVLLLLANPWIYWVNSWDFHFETVGIVFVLLSGKTLNSAPNSKRLWIYVVLALASGDVTATYLFALALGAFIASSGGRRSSATVAAMSLAWLGVLVAIGANKGSGLAQGYSYLAVTAGPAAPASPTLSQIALGLVRHPAHLASVLRARWLDIYGALGPSGIIGGVYPWVLPAVVLVILENGLNRYGGFIAPGFQDQFLYYLVPLGTVLLIARIAGRHRRIAILSLLAVSANALAWGIVWIPRISAQWLRVSPAAESALGSIINRIGPDSEVIASQGIIGAFSGRRWVYGFQGPGYFPIRERRVWVVVVPRQGIETASVASSDALIGELAASSRAHLVLERAGVWVYLWTPRRTDTRALLAANYARLPAWAAVSKAGVGVESGPSSTWYAAASGKAGYVVAKDYWPLRRGAYVADVSLATTGPADVEVWDATTSKLLARKIVAATTGRSTVSLPFNLMSTPKIPEFAGRWLFKILPLSSTGTNEVEVRVFSGGGYQMSVYYLLLRPQPLRSNA